MDQAREPQHLISAAGRRQHGICGHQSRSGRPRRRPARGTRPCRRRDLRTAAGPGLRRRRRRPGRRRQQGLRAGAGAVAGAWHPGPAGPGRACAVRLDSGTYGICEQCGNKIPTARLEAFPFVTLCVTCKQLEERH
ncbi:TraR/DksA family transcriptional regulator [Fodinicola feengrottensis]|uniref:TraR/DksA family transcriptional regulator n=1 Tax=Fodinicola feengrottensis TaxID=435914 RepID=UPI0036F1ADE6